jgi:site-specific DNA recombinase
MEVSKGRRGAAHPLRLAGWGGRCHPFDTTLADIEAGKIDVVVVYKIDRLTRSLADFARIVEQFDARDVSFVSVTQAFSTTSSMGRLTLNVLLSFAQFEREVTGERIRDKIAASKAKGMWMGGIPPLGYDLPEAGSRMLRVNDDEAVTVRKIYHRYLEIGSVHKLAEELAGAGVTSKVFVTGKGKQLGGTPIGRGALFHLLRNRIYLGQICHKDQIFDGEHQPVIDEPLFLEVQKRLAAKSSRSSAKTERRAEQAILTGRLVDAHGEIMSPAFSRGRGGRLYRYYVSASAQQGKADKGGTILRRVAAPAIEQLVSGALKRILPAHKHPLDHLKMVRFTRDKLILVLSDRFIKRSACELEDGETIEVEGAGACAIILPMRLPLRGGRRSVEVGQKVPTLPDPTLIAALRRAHILAARNSSGVPTVTSAPKSPYDRAILRLAFLAPDIQRDILAGRQPARVNLQAIMQASIPLDWNSQRVALGWDR